MKIKRSELLKELDILEEELFNDPDLIPNAVKYANKYRVLTGKDKAKTFTI